MARWSDQTPHECDECFAIFSDDCNVHRFGTDNICDECAMGYFDDWLLDLRMMLEDYEAEQHIGKEHDLGYRGRAA